MKITTIRPFTYAEWFEGTHPAVFTNAFQWISRQDWINCRLVCRKWRKICNDPQVLKGIYPPLSILYMCISEQKKKFVCEINFTETIPLLLKTSNGFPALFYDQEIHHFYSLAGDEIIVEKVNAIYEGVFEGKHYFQPEMLDGYRYCWTEDSPSNYTVIKKGDETPELPTTMQNRKIGNLSFDHELSRFFLMIPSIEFYLANNRCRAPLFNFTMRVLPENQPKVIDIQLSGSWLIALFKEGKEFSVWRLPLYEETLNQML